MGVYFAGCSAIPSRGRFIGRRLRPPVPPQALTFICEAAAAGGDNLRQSVGDWGLDGRCYRQDFATV
jgi:hypothetical protein